MHISIVIWRDAHSLGNEWMTADDAAAGGDYLVCTAGWKLDTDSGGKAGHISIVRSLTEDEYLDSVLHIPEQMVLRQIDLHEVTHETIPLERDETGRISPHGVPPSSGAKGTA